MAMFMDFFAYEAVSSADMLAVEFVLLAPLDAVDSWKVIREDSCWILTILHHRK